MKNKLMFLAVCLLLGSCSKNNSEQTPATPIPSEELSGTWHAGEGQFNGSLEFGNLTDSATKILTVTVKNEGETILAGPMQLQGSDFSLVYSNCDQLLPGKSCLIKVSFNPENKINQIYTASLIFDSAQADLSASVNLSTVIEDLTASLGGIPISGTVDFGTIKFDQSIIKNILIVNHGKKIGPITLSKAGNEFIVNYDNCSGKMLLEKSSCSIKISLSGAGKSGIISDTLTIGSISIPVTAFVKNLPTVAEEESNIQLLVNNVAPVVGVMDLGTWNLGKNQILNMYLKNQGTDSGIVQVPTLDSSLQMIFNNCTDGKILAPKESCLIKASTIPKVKGTLSSQVIVQGSTVNLQSLVRVPGDKIYCPMDNADESYITWTGSIYSQCIIEACDVDYHLIGNQCEPDVIICEIDNGTGTQSWDGSDYAECQVNSCTTGFHVFNNSCDSNTISCSIINGQGTQVWNGFNYTGCSVSACDPNFHQEANLCINDTQNCTVDNGSGTKLWNGSSYNACQVNNCITNYHIASNQCVFNTQSCSIDNGIGTQSWGATDWNPCQVVSCNQNYHQQANSCVIDVKTVTITQPSLGQGTISGPTSVNYNSSATFTYAPNSPYVLSSWGGSCSGSTNTCTINPVLGNLTVSANIACISGYTMISNVCLRNVNLTISSNTQNYNLFSAASSPADKVLVTLTVNSGVVVGSSSTSGVALNTGSGWVSGSVIRLVNNGSIVGAGGVGGYGSEWSAAAENGYPGGNALVLNYALSITNNGIIGGGGGGGGGGSGFSNAGNYCRSGGGGGGGAGNIIAGGGSFATCGGRPYDNPGSSGTLSTGGNGGASISDGARTSGTGGKGGDLGQNGAAGIQSVGSGSWGLPAPGQGGAAGKAVISNGNTINWISGNDAAHVKGAIQ